MLGKVSYGCTQTYLDNHVRNRIGIIYRLGIEIQKKYPELYRGYFKYTFKELAQKLKLHDDKYSEINLGILTNALRHAIIGFEENDYHEGYQGQLTQEKYEEVKHCPGKICYKNGEGLFKLTREQRQEIGRKNIAHLMVHNNHQVWTPQEKERFFELRNNEIQRGKRPSYKLICERLECEFPYRTFTPKGLESLLQREKREKGEPKREQLNWSKRISDRRYGNLELVELAYFYSQEDRYKFSKNKIKVGELAEYLSELFNVFMTESSLRKALIRYRKDVEQGLRKHPRKITTPQLELIRTSATLEELLEIAA